jgi:hypothetical protein
VNTGISTAVDGSDTRLQFLIMAQRIFDCRHALGGQSFIEEGFEIGVGETVGHIISHAKARRRKGKDEYS